MSAQVGFVPTNPDLADILGRMDFDFDNFHLFFGFQIHRFPGSQIFRFPALPAPPPDELSDPNLIPLPAHPGIKYVARALAATDHRRGLESSLHSRVCEQIMY